MPRVLILCEYPTLLGGERSMLTTLPRLVRSGWEPVVAGPAPSALSRAVEEQGCAIVPWRQSTQPQLPLPARREEFEQFLAQQPPFDLLHANSLAMARLAGPVAKLRCLPSLGHLRDILGLSRQAVRDLNCHSRLLAVSEATRLFHLRQGLDGARCAVLHNGVDLENFRPAPPTGYLHRELQLPSAARLLLSIGQLSARKGVDVAMAAATQLVVRFPDLVWIFAGAQTSDKQESREFVETLREHAGRPPLAGHVHFVGTRSDVPQLLVECEVLVHAARQEPLGRVLLEAGAAGCAVVATAVGGTREIFTDASQALLVPAGEVDSLATGISELLTNPRLRGAQGRAARARMEASFAAEHATDRLLAHYNEMLS